MLDGIKRNLQKDFRIEFRNRSAFYISVIFAAIITISISLVAGYTPFSPKTHSILLWLITFFSAMNALPHTFIREEEEKTALFLMLNSSPGDIIASKLLFNTVFFLIIQIFLTPLYIFFLQIDIRMPAEFILTILAGGVSIATSATLLGAITAKSDSRNSLFTIISFPILLPVIWIAITATEAAIAGMGFKFGHVLFLLAFSGVLTEMSFMLFKHIYR